MIEIFISGQRVTLPSDIAIKFVDENPFFTKGGTFTYDVELSLLDDNNARIFKHLNRLNWSDTFDDGRSAIFIVDNQVYLKGSMLILSKSDKSVSVQLVSGNAELNYLSGSDLKIRSLDLGFDWYSQNTIPLLWDNEFLDLQYPNVDALNLPFSNTENENIGNRCHLYKVADSNPVEYKLRYTYDGNQQFKNAASENVYYLNMRPQPYLCFIIEKILNNLGYTVIENQIALHAILKNVYLVHGYDTIEWAKMLPDWTVSEFFTQVENFFDCTIVVDNISNNAYIKFNHSYYDAIAQEITVIDTYSNDVDPDNHLSHKGTNIGFSLDGDDYYKMGTIENVITDVADVISIPSTDPQTILSTLLDAMTEQENKFSKIFRTWIGDFIAYNDGVLTIPKEINFLKPVYNNPDSKEDLDMELKIIPAPMKVVNLTIYNEGDAPTETTSKYHMQLPVVEYSDPFLFLMNATEPVYNIQKLITGAESIKNITLSDKMRIALYDGRKAVNAYDSSGNIITASSIEHYPISYVKSLAEYFCNLNTRVFFLSDQSKPLSPKWLWNNIYSLGLNVDTTNLYKFSFLSNNAVNVQQKFLIKNKLFLCEHIERDIDDKGFKPLYYGEFYPII